MNRRTTLAIGGLLLAAGLSGVAGFVIGRSQIGRPKPETIGPSTWVRIRSYRGVVDPSAGNVDVQVYSAQVVPGDIESNIILQNKIVLVDSEGPVEFLWPRSDEFAASQCEIEDLDGDGTKEFVLFAGEYAVRVVSYRNRRFTFREGQGVARDELTSAAKGLQMLDLNGDGRFEFATLSAVAIDPKARLLEFRNELRVMEWHRVTGFRDAPTALFELYQRRFPAVREGQ